MRTQPGSRQADPNPIWATWTYTPEEWAHFDEDEQQRVQAQWHRVRRLAGACGISFLTFVLFAGSGQSSFLNCAVFFVFLVLGGRAVGVAAQAQNQGEHHARQRGPAQVIIGPGSITIGQDLIELPRKTGWATDQNGYTLHWVEYTLNWVRLSTQAPLRIVLTLQWTRGGSFFEIRVPVPAGKEAEARSVVARYERTLLGTDWTALAAQRRAEAAERQAERPPPLPTRPVTPRIPTSHATRRLPQSEVGSTLGAQGHGQTPAAALPPASDTPTRRLSPDEVR